MAVRTLDPNRRSNQAETLAQRFALRIVGQADATVALSSVLEKIQSGFYDKTKPLASLLFLGPTGTGKTATVEAFTLRVNEIVDAAPDWSVTVATMP